MRPALNTIYGLLILVLLAACEDQEDSSASNKSSDAKEQSSYTLNVNGTSFVSDGPLNLEQGDTILLFSSQAGG